MWYRFSMKTARASQFSFSRGTKSPRSRSRILRPEGASRAASVPPPAPVPMMAMSYWRSADMMSPPAQAGRRKERARPPLDAERRRTAKAARPLQRSARVACRCQSRRTAIRYTVTRPESSLDRCRGRPTGRSARRSAAARPRTTPARRHRSARAARRRRRSRRRCRGSRPAPGDAAAAGSAREARPGSRESARAR